MAKENKKKEKTGKREDLIKEMHEKLVTLRDMRFGVAGSKSKNVKEQKNTKREIARIKTALNTSSQ